MTDETGVVLRGEKNAGIIRSLSDLYGIGIEESADLYYNSDTFTLIEDKVADLHCRSDKYLATLVMDEYKDKTL
ncbi:MAG: DUF3791 domain-containing protein [Muribaculaceae bacterium]|nr:DUF3791 domain-containing protein [Muribaculaceae bacterium]